VPNVFPFDNVFYLFFAKPLSDIVTVFHLSHSNGAPNCPLSNSLLSHRVQWSRFVFRRVFKFWLLTVSPRPNPNRRKRQFDVQQTASIIVLWIGEWMATSWESKSLHDSEIDGGHMPEWMSTAVQRKDVSLWSIPNDHGPTILLGADPFHSVRVD
jgi:hypothetical protein